MSEPIQFIRLYVCTPPPPNAIEIIGLFLAINWPIFAPSDPLHALLYGLSV